MSLSTLTALAVLEGPRSPEGKPNTIIFDGQIYLGGERSLVAGLRYYNESGIVFDGITICHIVANIAKYTPDLYVHLLSEMDKDDYHLYGDIVQLIPLPATSNPGHYAFLHVAGTCSTVNDAKSEFTVETIQRLSGIPQAVSLTLPVLGYMPDSPKYMKDGVQKKPMPKANTIICATGKLIDAVGLTKNTPAERFKLEVVNIAFLNRASTAPAVVATADSPKTPKKLKFRFGADLESPTKRRRVEEPVNAVASSSKQ